ncbi:sigma factor [Thermocatellispora tengchongensis]
MSRSGSEPEARGVRDGDVSPAGTTDEQLIRALFDDHGGPLYGYVLRLTGDPGRAEDVVQETLLRAWRHPDALAGRPVRAWLFTVARNLVVDQHRARRSRPRRRVTRRWRCCRRTTSWSGRWSPGRSPTRSPRCDRSIATC